METALVLSPERLATGQGMPGHCVWHGRPAVRRRDLVIPSKPEITTPYGLEVLRPGAHRLAEWRRKVRHVPVRNWPLCDWCVQYRVVWFSLSCLMFWGAAAALGTLVVVNRVEAVDAATSSLVFFACFAVALGSVVPFVRGGYGRITGTRASDDGTALLVDNAHPLFAAEAAPLRADPPPRA